MRILLVFATEIECKGLLDFLKNNTTSYDDSASYFYKNLSVEFLVTGVGTIATCFQLTRKLTKTNYDLIINLGIAGAFDPNIPLGSIFLVSQDRFGDLGIEDASGAFYDVFETGLTPPDSYPFLDGWLKVDIKKYKLDDFTTGKAVTVNKVTGSNISISKISEKYHPDLESMEGAACFYVAKMQDIPCIQIRAVSNHVEPRDKSKWNIDLALENLSTGCLKILEKISGSTNSTLSDSSTEKPIL